MKVTIRDLASGKNKTMEKRYADVLVKMRRAVYVGGEVSNKPRQTYQTKVMVAENTPSEATTTVVNVPAEVPEFNEKATAEEILASFGISNPVVPTVTTVETTEAQADEQPKRRGRPPKNREE